MLELTEIPDRAVRLFTYLRELAQLRTKITRNLDLYEEVLWFYDIPNEAECQQVDWFQQGASDSEFWIEIQKPRLTSPPALPEHLVAWVDHGELRISDQDEPHIKEKIIVEDKSSDENNNMDRLFFDELADHPEVQDIWNQYVTEKWKPWAEIDRKKQSVQRIYNRLFSAYQRQQRLGEAYEIIVGFGLLDWHPIEGKPVRRHLITAQAAIHFDATRGTIAVGPPAEGVRIILEQDMLEPSERPNSDEQNALETQVREMEHDFFDLSKLESVLKRWVQSASSKGNYRRDLNHKNETSADPCVILAPALILRQRTERSFIRTFQEIVAQISETGKVPKGVERVVSITDDINDASGDSHHNDTTGLYFPLLSNREQMEIADKLMQRQGILVQGPPGTGKSHSIVNLICHLLACGKRVLITSHTARALQVLKHKMPEEISALCVSLLGNDREALQALEDSVQKITDRHNHWSAIRSQETIHQLEKEIEAYRTIEAQTQNELRSLREAETYRHPPLFGGYEGTLQQIAHRLQKEKEHLGWIRDSIDSEQEPPINNEAAQRLLTLLRKFELEHEAELRKPILDGNTLPEPKRFGELASAEADAKNRYEEAECFRNHPAYYSLKVSNRDLRVRLTERIDALVTHIQNLKRDTRTETWLEQAVSDILRGKYTTWQTLFNITNSHLEKFNKVTEQISKAEVENWEQVGSVRILRLKAEDLLFHLERGGKLRIFGFIPSKIAKQCDFLINKVRVDGRACDTPETLRILIAWCEVTERMADLKENWAHCAVSETGKTMLLQLAEWWNREDFLKRALGLQPHLNHVKMAFALLQNFPEPDWADLEAILTIKQVAETVTLEEDFFEAQQVFSGLESSIQEVITLPDSHVLVKTLRTSVLERNIESYSQVYHQMISLIEDRNRLQERDALLTKLRWGTPLLAKELKETCKDISWDNRTANFIAAWNWTRASIWLAKMNDSQAEERVRRKLDDDRQRRQILVGKLVSEKAWASCFHNLTESQRQHLIAWVEAVRRIGKGTGRHAQRHRRTAQKNMEYCRTAIPAWIMPIYQVAETIRPEPDLFDVVIVDEASQSGPEALFLMYLARQIIVVGDDRQISPESVGVNRDEVELLRQRYVADLPHSETLDVDASLFTHASIRYGGRIRLREHFRCMPEIIQYSNNLCYSSEPLTPLRQYGTDRLEPIHTIYISGGYLEGGRNPLNPTEARAIVNQIRKCCETPAYKDKTMGVISLLGDAQARYIEQILVDEVGPEEMEKRHLFCGDAYAFQGDERDIMFLSMVSAPMEGRRIGTLASTRDERRFNVAVSRAKDQLWLFHSVTLNDLNSKCLRYNLLEYCLKPSLRPSSLEDIDLQQLRLNADNSDRGGFSVPQPFDSWFEVDVFLKIIERKFRVVPQYEVAGYYIDLVVEGMAGKLAVECDGDTWHGPDRYDSDMDRQRQLERCGWTFWRIRGSTYYRNPDIAMASLWETLERLNIDPQGHAVVMDNIRSSSILLPAEVNVEIEASSSDSSTVQENTDTEDSPYEFLHFKDSDKSDEVKTATNKETESSLVSTDVEGLEDSLKTMGMGRQRLSKNKYGIELLPYHAWNIRPIGNLMLMTTKNIEELFLEIVRVEGPVICRRVYRLSAKAAGVKEIPKSTRSLLNEVMWSLVVGGKLRQHDEYHTNGQINKVVRLPDQPLVLMRERGGREIDEILPGEMAKVIKKLAEFLPIDDEERIFQAIMECYDSFSTTEESAVWSIYMQAKNLMRKN